MSGGMVKVLFVCADHPFNFCNLALSTFILEENVDDIGNNDVD